MNYNFFANKDRDVWFSPFQSIFNGHFMQGKTNYLVHVPIFKISGSALGEAIPRPWEQVDYQQEWLSRESWTITAGGPKHELHFFPAWFRFNMDMMFTSLVLCKSSKGTR